MLKVIDAVGTSLINRTNLTTSDIAKLANKNATLASYLTLTESENGIKNY